MQRALALVFYSTTTDFQSTPFDNPWGGWSKCDGGRRIPNKQMEILVFNIGLNSVMTFLYFF